MESMAFTRAEVFIDDPVTTRGSTRIDLPQSLTKGQ
jgi:hypothetical protein